MTQTKTRFLTARRLVLLSVASAMAVVLLAACGPAAPDNDRPTIGFIQADWTSHTIVRTVAETVVRDQLGYPVHGTRLDVTPGWAALCNEDVHIGMEAWLPSRLPEIQPFLDQDCVELGGINFIGEIGWFVPRYVIEGDPARGIEPMAPNLRSVEDLNDYWQLFENPARPGMGELMGGEVGWIDHPQDLSRIQGYDLNFYRSNQTEPVLLAEITARYLTGEPFLNYLWTPHFIFAEVDLVMLEEPDEFSEEECFLEEGVPYRCPHPQFDIHTAMNTNLKNIAPDVYNLIYHFNISEEDVSRMLFEVESEGRTYEEVAEEWIAENQSRIDQWIAGNRV